MNERMKDTFNMATLTLLGPTPTEWMNIKNPTISINIKVPKRVKDYLDSFNKEFSGTEGGDFFDLLLSDLIIIGLKTEAKRLVKEGLLGDLVESSNQQDEVPDIPDFM